MNKARSIDQATPLHAAAYKGHADVIRALVAKGAHLNPRRDGGSTPLLLASQVRPMLQCCSLAQIRLCYWHRRYASVTGTAGTQHLRLCYWHRRYAPVTVIAGTLLPTKPKSRDRAEKRT